MSDLIKNVTEGVIEQTKSNTKSQKASNELDKDAYLKPLVTQMLHQDPLNPSTDTEFIAQLATFSQLEQLQNISASSTNSQALNLVGKHVIVNSESATGEIVTVSGKVDFVNMTGNKAHLSIGGNLYGVEQLSTVIDDEYIFMQGLPGVKDKVELEFNGERPEDLLFIVDMGQGETKADAVAIVVEGELLAQEHVKVSEDKVIISKEALANLKNGVYDLTLIFNDPLLTTVQDMVTLQVKNFSEFI